MERVAVSEATSMRANLSYNTTTIFSAIRMMQIFWILVAEFQRHIVFELILVTSMNYNIFDLLDKIIFDYSRRYEFVTLSKRAKFWKTMYCRFSFHC